MPWPPKALTEAPEASYDGNATSRQGTPIRLGTHARRRSNRRAKRAASSAQANETALPCPLVPIRPQANWTIDAPKRSWTTPPKGQDVRIASMAFKTSVGEAPLRAGTLKVYPLLEEWA